jgi:quercetin dioxygenase-like cupin family protein
MSKSAGGLAGLLIPAIFVAGAVALPAMAQEKGKAAQRTQKVFIDNDKVRVTETTFKPGEVSPSIERPYRITRVIKGGKTIRTYADGKTVEREFKTGEVFAAGPDKPYSAKSISKTDIVLYSVNLKKVKGMQDKKPQATPRDPKKATVNVRLENDTVRVYEASIPVGAEAANVPRPYRIGRALQGATMQRIYADGKTETVQWKAGEVKALGPDRQYKPKNIGKTDFLIYVVEIK